MDPIVYLQAAILGLIEGLTEFLPVSSTGHLILLVDLLGFKGPEGKVFEIVIQLGAILAIIVLYWQKLFGVLVQAPTDPAARRFILNILLAFLPAAVAGVLLHDFIKRALFSPWVVCVALITGGLAILLIERAKPAPRHTEIAGFSPGLALGVGACQIIAMIPGVSRSGATIMGALLLGVERRAAAEFSFFLAIPTMLGATVYDLYKNRGSLTPEGLELIAIGFAVAFIAALLVVRALIRYLGRHDFTVFAYYRMALGAVMLAVLLARG